jgi:DNA-binding MarR family transcriptional regulator
MLTLRQTINVALRAGGIELSFVHAMVLRTLAKEPGISGAQVARRVNVTAQSMNSLLRSLESSGYVLREPHPENRRTDCWYITTVGLKQLQDGGAIVDSVMSRIRGSMSKADAAKLVELLQQCAGALQAGGGEKTSAPSPASRRLRAS